MFQAAEVGERLCSWWVRHLGKVRWNRWSKGWSNIQAWNSLTWVTKTVSRYVLLVYFSWAKTTNNEPFPGFSFCTCLSEWGWRGSAGAYPSCRGPYTGRTHKLGKERLELVASSSPQLVFVSDWGERKRFWWVIHLKCTSLLRLLPPWPWPG